MTRKRLAILTIVLLLLTTALVTFSTRSGLLKVFAQYYSTTSGTVPPAVVACGFTQPPQVVAGIITTTTGVSYAPNATSPVGGITLQAGSKWLVIGLDATKHYYKIMIGCALVWVPVGSIGPSPDAPAANEPLPTGIVSDSVQTPS